MSLLKQVYMHPRSKNTLVFSKNRFNFYLISKWFINDSCEAVQRISLYKPLLSVSPRCCDWSDGAVLCDWSTAYSACRKLNTHCHNGMTGDLSIHRKDGIDCTLPIRAGVWWWNGWSGWSTRAGRFSVVSVKFVVIIRWDKIKVGQTF